MNNNHSIRKNYIFNLISQFISFAIPLIVTPYISRIFLADGIGINSFTSANVAYFTLFSMLGISGYGQRETAIYRDDRKKTSEIFCELQLIHGITFIITGILFIFLIAFSKKYAVYYAAQSVMLLACFFDINWFYQAFEEFRFISIRNCVVKLLMLASVLMFVHEKDDLVRYILIVGLANLLSNLSLWIKISEYIDYIPIKNLHPSRHLKEILVFFIPTIAASVYSILDKSVINWITKEEAENGYYDQAYRILTVANVIVQSLQNVAAPRMAYVYSVGKSEEFRERLGKSLEFMLLIAAPVAFGICGIAPRFVPFFFGEGFEKTIDILYIFTPLIIILGFSVYLDGLYLVPSGRRAESAKVICMGAVLNLFLNAALVLRAKALGAAIATLITEGFISGMMINLSKEMIDGKKIIYAFLRYSVSSLLMFFVVRHLGKIIENDWKCILAQITSGAVIYGFILILMKENLTTEILFTVLNKIRKS